MSRICRQCQRSLPRTSYTANQYAKGDGTSRCAGCIHGHDADVVADNQTDSGRYNFSDRATFEAHELDYPFSSGSFRWVAKGKYVTGERQGQTCVGKWFKTGAVFYTDYFSLDIKAVDKALEIVNRFNELGVIQRSVKINVPTVWTFGAGERNGERALVEPFIQNYQKFNSNTGWNDEETGWAQAMQALSHFSYHVSGGNYVLCDLQGGIYRNMVVLSDPVILSRKREYGVTDLGANGITSFFSQHCCNNFCRSHWTAPANPRQIYRPVAGTTMIRRTLPSVSSRPCLTEYYD